MACYKRFNNLKKMTLDDLYNGNPTTLEALKENIFNVVDMEAPVTLNTLKARLREAFNVAKISQKALDIIMEDIKELGLKTTDNLYDIVLWPKEGIFDITELREGDRLIYDIPYQEMVLLARSINKSGEELYRSILEHFNLQVLTKKAFDYLAFVEKKM